MNIKRLLSVLLSFALLFSIIIPLNTFADEIINDDSDYGDEIGQTVDTAQVEESEYEEVSNNTIEEIVADQGSSEEDDELENLFEEVNTIDEMQNDQISVPEEEPGNVDTSEISAASVAETVVSNIESSLPETDITDTDIFASSAVTVTAAAEKDVVQIHDNVRITVTATNTVGTVSYQWQVSADGETSWTSTTLGGNKTETLEFEALTTRLSKYYRCMVKDDNGEWPSNVVKVDKVLEIETQPQSYTVTENEEATFTVSVKGGTEPYNYQWKYSREGGTLINCTEATATTPILKIQAEKKDDGKQFLCVIKDANGKEVTSEPATLTVTPAVAVTSSDPVENGTFERTITLTSTVSGEYAQTQYMWLLQFSTTAQFEADNTWIEVQGPPTTGSGSKTWDFQVVPNMNFYYRAILSTVGSPEDCRNPDNWICEPEATIHQLTTGDVAYPAVDLNVHYNGSIRQYYQFTAPKAGTYIFNATTASGIIVVDDMGHTLNFVADSEFNTKTVSLAMEQDQTVYVRVNAQKQSGATGNFEFWVTVEDAITISSVSLGEPGQQPNGGPDGLLITYDVNTSKANTKVRLLVSNDGTFTDQWYPMDKNTSDVNGVPTQYVFAPGLKLYLKAQLLDQNENVLATQTTATEAETRPLNEESPYKKDGHVLDFNNKGVAFVQVSGPYPPYYVVEVSATGTYSLAISGSVQPSIHNAKGQKLEITNGSFVITDNDVGKLFVQAFNIGEFSITAPGYYTDAYNALTYAVNGTAQTVSVTSFHAPKATTVYVPAEVTVNGQNYSVTEIGPEAFMDNKAITTANLPNSITVIGARAFKGCTSLSQMTTHD